MNFYMPQVYKLNVKKSIKIFKPCPINDQPLPKVSHDQLYCSSCHKNIYDFTKKTNKEVVHIFNTKKDVCGEFNSAETLNYWEILYHRRLAKFALTLLLVFGTSLYSFSQETQFAITNIKKELTAPKPTKTFIIFGTVSKTYGYETIKVFYNDSLLRVVPLDSNGNFSFEVPANYNNEILRFELNEFGFNSASRKIVKGKKIILKFPIKKNIHKMRGKIAYPYGH